MIPQNRRHRRAEHALSTAAAGPSQAPSAAVDKAAQQPLTNRFATTVSDGSWTIEIH
jgi:hypothetical protein|uniref:Uncharacterized protein n=1 Tax=Thiomonas intermedia (strain K12) TaxID=75379 RepID=D5X1D9_THIK1